MIESPLMRVLSRIERERRKIAHVLDDEGRHQWAEESNALEKALRLEAECAALRQRAEAAERELALLRWRCESGGHERERQEIKETIQDLSNCLTAEGNLKRAAYAVLDDVRKVVEEEIIPALQAVEHPVTPEGGDMGICARCGASEIMEHRPSCDLGRALAAARKTLTDTPKERE